MPRYRIFLLSLSVAALVLAIACSYGNYDGSYVASDAGSDGAGGEVVLTKTIDPTKQEVLATNPNVFELTIPPGAFDAPVTITITRLAERTIENNFSVPVYAVSAPKDPALPVQVQFRGSNPLQNPNQALLVAQTGADGTFRPTPLVSGATGGGSTGSFWGVTRRLTTYSLVFEAISQSNTFTDITSGSCLRECCPASNGNLNVSAVGGSCVCNGSPNLECFLRACPNLASVIERCVEVANTNAPSVSCKNSAPVPGCNTGICNYPGSGQCSGGTAGTSACCIDNHSGQCAMGTQGVPTCTGITVRCDRNTKCPENTKCCVFDHESYCASSCPGERTWCDSNTDCDGGVDGDAGDAGACVEARSCPHGTCGKPPDSCLN